MIPPAFEVLAGDVRARLAELPEDHFQTCITSPPYWRLRRYLPAGDPAAELEIGSEATFERWISVMVEVLDGVRRVLRPDGTLWLNLGDSYNTNEHGSSGLKKTGKTPRYVKGTGRGRVPGLKHKDLIGQPWALAFALRAAGWWLRSEIIWAKPNPLPESVRDRPAKAHETVFLLSRAERYFYDAAAVREPGVALAERNLRSVWTFPTEGATPGSDHHAAFPRALVEPCVLAGTSERGACPACGAPWARRLSSAKGGSIGKSWHPHEDDERTGHAKASTPPGYEPPRTLGWEPSCRCGAALEPIPCAVLDPFAGTGTTGEVALRHGRSFVGVELNPAWTSFAKRRLDRALAAGGAPLFDRRATAPARDRELFA